MDQLTKAGRAAEAASVAQASSLQKCRQDAFATGRQDACATRAALPASLSGFSAAPIVLAALCLACLLAMFTGVETAPGYLTPPLADSPSSLPQTSAPAAGFSLSGGDVLGLLVIGLISGTVGSMLAMGGGLFSVSFLIFFLGLHSGVARFASLLSYFAVAVDATYRYAKLGFIMKDVVKILVPATLAGIVAGAFIGNRVPPELIIDLLGIFLLAMAAVLVKRVFDHYRNRARLSDVAPQGHPAHGVRPRGRRRLPALWKTALCGFPGGIACALLGVSGGVITTPLQQLLAPVSLKNDIANTLATHSITVPFACALIMYMGVSGDAFDFWTPILAALLLIPGSLAGSQIGPALLKRMSPAAVHVFFAVMTFLLAINMLFFGE
jgi:uncharacterized membrane protein YfcA